MGISELILGFQDLHNQVLQGFANIEFLLWFSDIGESKMFNVDEIVRAAHREHTAG